MSNQVQDSFKFLWPFQNVRTLLTPNEYLTIPFIQTYGSLGTNYVDKERWVGSPILSTFCQRF